MPDRFGVPVVTTLVYFLHLYTRLRVRPAPGIPCALFFEGHDDAGPGHNSCRGNAMCVLAGCLTFKSRNLPRLRGFIRWTP